MTLAAAGVPDSALPEGVAGWVTADAVCATSDAGVLDVDDPQATIRLSAVTNVPA